MDLSTTMPAPYQRHKVTGSQGADGSCSSFNPSAQWSGSEGKGNSIMTNLPGMNGSEDSLLPVNGSGGQPMPIAANKAFGWSVWTYRMR